MKTKRNGHQRWKLRASGSRGLDTGLCQQGACYQQRRVLCARGLVPCAPAAGTTQPDPKSPTNPSPCVPTATSGAGPVHPGARADPAVLGRGASCWDNSHFFSPQTMPRAGTRPWQGPARLWHCTSCSAACAEVRGSPHALPDLASADPPDPPNNLTCSIHEYSGQLAYPTELGGAATRRTGAQRVMGLGTSVCLSTMDTPSSPTTIIHWRWRTLLENVRCEERHKAMGTPEWHVAAWDDAVQHGPRSQHDLQSNTQYVFQVRCRLSPADSPWSAWSPPFLYTTPEAGLPFTSATRGAVEQGRPTDLLPLYPFPDDDVGDFLGLGISMVTLSVVFLFLMFKKSARKRIKATVVSLLPKWLFEDFPHLENSNVVKSLQEKSDFTSNSFHEPFLDTSDPTVTEIEEVPAHKDYKTMGTRRKPSREVPEAREQPGSTAPASIVTPEQISGYKPQVSDGNPLGYVATNIYHTQLPTPLPEPEGNVFFRDYTSPVPQLWDGEGGEHHVCLLEKINLILNNSRSGQSHVFGLAQGGPGSLPENQWGHVLASDVQEQTLVPDELVSCLRAMNGESVDVKTCFPQSIGRLF
uniref:Interleukin-23 receptor n=1 Tax=Athene cunicularia TaxID=194338 RepID=A0A663M0I3_ATHCN